MPVLNYEIKIESIENGNVIEFKIPGKNCSEALGKLSSGRVRYEQAMYYGLTIYDRRDK